MKTAFEDPALKAQGWISVISTQYTEIVKYLRKATSTCFRESGEVPIQQQMLQTVSIIPLTFEV